LHNQFSFSPSNKYTTCSFDVKELSVHFELWQSDQGGYAMAKKEVVVTVRLTQDEVDALDRLTVGQFSRSQVVRIVLLDLLKRSEREQKAFLTKRAFG
jgi:hypothetical protein